MKHHCIHSFFSTTLISSLSCHCSTLHPIPFHPTLSNSFSSHPIASFSTPSLFIPSYPTDQPNPFVETSRRLHEDAEQRVAQQRWLERQVENARHAQYTFQPAINPGTTAMFDKGVEHRPIHERIADIQRDQRLVPAGSSICPVNTSYQHTLPLHPINICYQYTSSTNPVNPLIPSSSHNTSTPPNTPIHPPSLPLPPSLPPPLPSPSL